MTGKAAVLDASDHTWSRTYPDITTDGVFYLGFTEKFVDRNGSDNRPYMKSFVDGKLYRECKAG